MPLCNSVCRCVCVGVFVSVWGIFVPRQTQSKQEKKKKKNPKKHQPAALVCHLWTSLRTNPRTCIYVHVYRQYIYLYIYRYIYIYVWAINTWQSLSCPVTIKVSERGEEQCLGDNDRSWHCGKLDWLIRAYSSGQEMEKYTDIHAV